MTRTGALIGISFTLTGYCVAVSADTLGRASCSPDAGKPCYIANSCVKPAYPPEALNAGQEGVVRVGLRIGEDGQVKEGRIERTSGFPLLDAAALSGLQTCGYLPAIVNGKPQAMWTSLEYAWTISSSSESEVPRQTVVRPVLERSLIELVRQAEAPGANYDQPLFGGLPKTELQLRADRWLVEVLTEKAGSRELAAKVMLDLGWNYLIRGESRLAIRRFNQAQLFTPDVADIFWGYGAALLEQDKDEEALNYLERAYSSDPQSPERVAPFAIAAQERGAYKVAVKLFRFWADHGIASAQRSLGFMYEKGQGVTRYDAEAVRLYRLAAEQGDIYGEYNLGAMYERGQGVERDETEAVKSYQKAAEKGLALAQNSLAGMYRRGAGVPKDYAEALKWVQRAADQGHATAQVNLGTMYAAGEGIPTDEVEAVKWFRKAAEQGYAQAQTKLGSSFFSGRGVTKDFGEAVVWWRRAAEQGDATAQFLLGGMYELGQGVEKDHAEAKKWFQKAAEQGDTDAMQALESLRE